MKINNLTSRMSVPSKKRIKLMITESQFKSLAERVVTLQKRNELDKTHLVKNAKNEQK